MFSSATESAFECIGEAETECLSTPIALLHEHLGFVYLHDFHEHLASNDYYDGQTIYLIISLLFDYPHDCPNGLFDYPDDCSGGKRPDGIRTNVGANPCDGP